MANTTEPEKYDPDAGEEPSGDWPTVYTDGDDGIFSEKESSQSQVPAWNFVPLRSFEVCILTSAILSCTVGAMLLLLAIRAAIKSSPMVGWHHEGSPPQRALNMHKTLQATPFQLDLPAIYPDISSPPGSACREAWDALVSVECHDLIFDRDRDNGFWSPVDALPEICDQRCHPSLETAHDRLAANCSASDAFVLRNYDGKIPLPDLLEGPTSAIATLLRRNEYLCRVDIDADSDSKYCVTEMWERFGVTDERDVNLEGIEAFIKVSTENRMAHGESSYGWGRSEMFCGFCVMDFLSHVLDSWADGAITDPKTGASVSLSEFIRRVKSAGDRCVPSNTWIEIYCKAVSRYLEAGSLLPSDLDDLEECKPPHDLDYLMRNGPSKNDALISEIKVKLELLAARNNFTRPVSTEGIVSSTWSFEDVTTGACLYNLGRHYLSVPCYINLSKEEFEYILNEPQSESSILSAYCREECSDALSPLKSPKCENPTEEARNELSKYWTAKQRREQFCKLTTPVSPSDNCAKALVQMGKTEWVTSRGVFREIPLAEIDEELRKLKARAPVPSQLKLGAMRAQQPLQDKDGNDDAQAQWKNELGASICAGCFWNWAAGTNREETFMNPITAPSREEYVEFLKRYHNTCTSLGVDWLGGTPYGDDPVIWRVKEPNGDVMRYMESAEGQGSQPDRIYSVREADGRFRLEPTMKPGLVTLWHLLELERELKAPDGMLAEARLAEKKHREEADALIFGPDPIARVKYIGPEGGFGEKESEH